ncbi:MAG: 16S rRNA (cytidine(1402)-2'-O)-methyltransferase [bacterium]|nr:16S rRNA (cytidine(1402)-2'-O)-methyltransferase [Acidimicrobiia bacterium]MCY4648943.1 16S rRNA (cytidine(1402)-2'-O)-methyltransferase [bacterium]
MAGLLILCGTPIGNLADAPPRLAEALSGADCVYAEDTRRSGKLFKALGVTPRRLRSFFAGNENSRTAELAGRLAAGETVALVTDAGTPGISDPGLLAVRAAFGEGARVTIVPGPSAVTASLAVSGLAAGKFTFEGFLPRSGEKRARRIGFLAGGAETVVLFSSPHRLREDLEDLAVAGMGDRPMAVVRELTKLHEEVWTGTVSDACREWSVRAPQGEFTLVIGGGSPSASDEISGRMVGAAEAVARLVSAGLPTSAAVREVARLLEVPRRDLYGLVHG